MDARDYHECENIMAHPLTMAHPSNETINRSDQQVASRTTNRAWGRHYTAASHYSSYRGHHTPIKEKAPHQVRIGGYSDGPRPRCGSARGHDGHLEQHPWDQRAPLAEGRLVGLTLEECRHTLDEGIRRIQGRRSLTDCGVRGNRRHNTAYRWKLKNLVT